MKRITALVIVLLLIVVSGCGGQGGVPGTGTQKRFTLTATDLTITKSGFLAIETQRLPIIPKDSSSIRIVRESGFSEAVKLEIVGLPQGVSAEFSANNVTTNGVYVKLSAKSNAPLITKEITVKGSAVNGAKAETKFNLTIKKGQHQEGFAVSIAPIIHENASGTSSTSEIIISRSLGFVGTAINLSLVNLPPCFKYKINPNPATKAKAALIITQNDPCPAGSNDVTLKAVAGSKSATAILKLTIKDKKPNRPRILSISPGNGAKGVHDDVKIVVKFSIAMNSDSVEAAYYSNSAGLRPAEVKFNWNVLHNELSIRPKKKLEYKNVEDLNVAPNKYSFGFRATAKDLYDQNITNPRKIEFFTLRRFHKYIVATQSAEIVKDNGVYNKSPIILIGDNQSNKAHRAIVGFDISAVPANRKIDFVRLSVYQEGCIGKPYKSFGYAMLVDHVNVGSAIELDDFYKGFLSSEGSFLVNYCKVGKIYAIVTDSVKDDIVHRGARGNRSQFRFRFNKETDGDNENDIAKLYSSRAKDEIKRPTLEIVYLIE